MNICYFNILRVRDAQIFQISNSHLEIRVTQSKFNVECPQTLGALVLYLVYIVTRVLSAFSRDLITTHKHMNV